MKAWTIMNEIMNYVNSVLNTNCLLIMSSPEKQNQTNEFENGMSTKNEYANADFWSAK